jgi:hypothetical protein
MEVMEKKRPYSLEWDPLVYHSNYLRLLRKDPTHYTNSFQREGISFNVTVDGYPWLNPFISAMADGQRNWSKET